MKQEKIFSKTETNMIKGVALLLLLHHHLFNGVLNTPIHWFGGDSYTQIIATLSKVCVALFVILSGYGLSEQYSKTTETDFIFVKKRFLNLMKQYWYIFIIFIPLGFVFGCNPIDVYGSGLIGFKNLMIDFFGLFRVFDTPTMNYTWWYMETAMVLYLLFPLLYKITRKIPTLTMVITTIPLIIACFFKTNVNTCKEIYWFLPFCFGIMCSQHNIFNKYLTLFKNRKTATKIFATIFFIIMLFIRSKLGLIIDTLFALSIIFITLCIKTTIIKKPLIFIGNHSANIFFTHSFVYYYFSDWANLLHKTSNNNFTLFMTLLISCLGISILINFTKKHIIDFKN